MIGVQQTVVTCVPEVITENDDSHQLARVLANIDDELEMSRRHEPTRGLTTSVLAGRDTRTLRVWCPHAAAPGFVKNKGRGDSTGSADRSIKQCGIGREVPADHEAQGQKCSDDCRSRVRSCRRATNDSQEEIGIMNQKPSMAEQDHGARSQGRRERRWSGSPWKQGLTTT